MKLEVWGASPGFGFVSGFHARAPGLNPVGAVLFMILLWMSIPFLLMGLELASPLRKSPGAEEAG